MQYAVDRGEPFITVTAEIPEFMSGSGFGFEIGGRQGSSDARAIELLNSTIGTTQEAIDNGKSLRNYKMIMQ